MSRYVYAVLCVLIVAFVLWYSFILWPGAKVISNRLPEEVDHEVRWSDWIIEFDKNEVLFKEKYIDKTIQITGIFDTMIQKGPVQKIILREENSITSVICRIHPTGIIEEDTLLQRGSEVILKGFVERVELDFHLDNCLLISPSLSSR
jgi:hypothetical protein